MATLTTNTNNNNVKILTKVNGDLNKSNDVLLLLNSTQQPTSNAQFNLLFFPGDVQDYPDEMKKHPTNRSYVDWNLFNTSQILCNKFNESKNYSNVFTIKADSMHLKTFAKYSNFLKVNDFGAPVSDNDETPLNALSHLNALYRNVCLQETIDSNLDIILCAFSKGCIVLNKICTELLSVNEKLKDENEALFTFISRIKHVIWLDGGHCGSKHAWLTDESVIKKIKEMNICLYVYVTPYQISEFTMKKWAVKEHKIFLQLLDKYSIRNKHNCYFSDTRSSYENDELIMHFNILKSFDSSLLSPQ